MTRILVLATVLAGCTMDLGGGQEQEPSPGTEQPEQRDDGAEPEPSAPLPSEVAPASIRVPPGPVGPGG